MQILVDADACPVVGIVERVAKEYKIPVTLLCDTNHVLSSDYSEIRVIGAGADAVDFALVGICRKDDIVVTQDYGVAAMILGKGACGIHQSGKWYTDENIDQLLMERHISKKARRAKSKHHIKGPSKRTEEDDRHFEESFRRLIEKCQGDTGAMRDENEQGKMLAADRGEEKTMVKPIMKDIFFLGQKSEPATEADRQVGQDLLDTLQAHSAECVGMAANMIGVKKNIIVVNTGYGNILMYNPVIRRKSGVYEAEEGCLSLSGVRKCTRYRDIEVEYQDVNFKKCRQKFSGWTAQIICHECDHLEGKII